MKFVGEERKIGNQWFALYNTAFIWYLLQGRLDMLN